MICSLKNDSKALIFARISVWSLEKVILISKFVWKSVLLSLFLSEHIIVHMITYRIFGEISRFFFLKCTKDNQLAAWRAELDQSGRRKLTKRELNDCQEIVSLFFGHFWPFSSRAILPIIRGILQNSFFFDRSFLANFGWFSCYF